MKDDVEYLDKGFIKKMRPKLVRDKVPYIIVAQHKKGTFSRLNGQILVNKRKDKVLKELKEAILIGDFYNVLEEISDLIEILCFWEFDKWDNKFLTLIKDTIKKKQKESGSFKENYYLEKVVLLDE